MLKEEEQKAYKCLNLSEDIYLILQKSVEELESVNNKDTELILEIKDMIEKLEAI